MKGLHWKTDTLCDKFQPTENRESLIKSSTDAVEQYVKKNYLTVSHISDSVQNSRLESTVTQILSYTDVNIKSKEAHDFHRIALEI